MAAITWQILSTVAVTPNWWGPITEGSSTSASNTLYGFAPARAQPVPVFFEGNPGSTFANSVSLSSSYTALSTGPVHGTNSTNTGDSFASTRPLSGTFATGNWTFNLNMRATVAGAVGRMRVRIWASSNADGSGARALSTSLVGATITLSTSADQNSSITWAV